MSRFKIFRSSKSDNFLCICMARDKKHAIKIARRMFRLDRTAFAIPE